MHHISETAQDRGWLQWTTYKKLPTSCSLLQILLPWLKL